MRVLTTIVAILVLSCPAHADRLPLFDAHLHYSHDAWESFSVEAVIGLLREAGIKRALLSSSDDRGQQRLLDAAPDLIVPELRPYRRRGETMSWVRDESVIAYLEENLRQRRYVGIGEFHLNGADADLPVPRRLVALARRHDLLLHIHGDGDAVTRLYRQWPEARVLWAHAGFAPPAEVRTMLEAHPNLWCDLSFRSEVAPDDGLDPEWRALFLAFPDRFLVGTDTYTPQRWHAVAEHARWARRWLAELPEDVAQRIAWKNGEFLLNTVGR